MTSPWLTVVGVGEDGADGLSPAALRLVQGAGVLVGGARHLELIPPVAGQRRIPWPTPFSVEFLEELRGTPVVVLASGDPLWFGVGATLGKAFTPAEVRVLPHPGAFSLAAAAMGWPLQDCVPLTVHGRPLDGVRLHLAPGARLLILSENGRTPAALAALLRQAGYGASRMTVLERLGGPAERRMEGRAQDWDHGPAHDLNTIAVQCFAAPETPVLARVPGLPDDLFEHDGQITKREVRAVTLSALAPTPGAVLWDVGAGCGSIAIEWMRAGGFAVAVERDTNHCDMIARNAALLGVPGLQVLAGAAPEALEDLKGSIPDAVFIGGGVTRDGVLDQCWEALKPGGRLVANAVTVESEAVLLAWQARQGGRLIRLSVSRLAPTGRFHSWRPFMPVTQYCGIKP